MKSIKPKDITRDWHLIDAKNQTLGRLSTEVAVHLMGKNKVIYSPNLDTGDYVVVINTTEVKLSGNKEASKTYYHHSGYPGGLYKKTVARLRAEKPNDIVINAVYGMLPKTKMGKIMLKKLFVFPNGDHPHKDKFKK